MDDRHEVSVTSTSNRWIKLARSLHRRRARYRERAILVEGVRPVQECIATGTSLRALLVAESRDPAADGVVKEAISAGIFVVYVEDSVFSTAADTETPQGILAIADMPEAEIPDTIPSEPLVLIVDSVRDPGNLGTLLRASLGSAVDLVLIAPKTVDPWSPKVVRAGAGSHFRMPIAFLNWDQYPQTLSECRVLVTQADGDLDYALEDLTKGVAIVVGNETSGVSEAAISHSDGRVGIPLANSLESLNAGIAGSVILFEAWRQRRLR